MNKDFTTLFVIIAQKFCSALINDATFCIIILYCLLLAQTATASTSIKQSQQLIAQEKFAEATKAQGHRTLSCPDRR